MPFISWSDKFSIGVKQIDDQHRKLFELVNNVYEHAHSDSAKDLINSSLNELIDYTDYHFKEEEAFMVSNEYIRYEQHKMAHDNLRLQVVDFKSAISQGKGDTKAFLKFLFDWLTKHIMDQDKKIGKYMEQRTLKPINDK